MCLRLWILFVVLTILGQQHVYAQTWAPTAYSTPYDPPSVCPNYKVKILVSPRPTLKAGRKATLTFIFKSTNPEAKYENKGTVMMFLPPGLTYGKASIRPSKKDPIGTAYEDFVDYQYLEWTGISLAKAFTIRLQVTVDPCAPSELSIYSESYVNDFDCQTDHDISVKISHGKRGKSETCGPTPAPSQSPSALRLESGGVAPAWTTACIFDMDGTIRGGPDKQQPSGKCGQNNLLCQKCTFKDCCSHQTLGLNACGFYPNQTWAKEAAQVIRKCWDDKRRIGIATFNQNNIEPFFKSPAVNAVAAPGTYATWLDWYKGEKSKRLYIRGAGFSTGNLQDYCGRNKAACESSIIGRNDKAGLIKSIFSSARSNGVTLTSAIFFDDCPCNIGYMLQSNEFPVSSSYKYKDILKVNGQTTEWTYCTYAQWVVPAHDKGYGAMLENLQNAEAKIRLVCPW